MRRTILTGFTLLEVLVATTLSAVLVGIALVVLHTGTTGYQDVTRRDAMAGEFRVAIGALRGDFANASRAHDPMVGGSSEPGAALLGLMTLKPLEVQSEEQAVGDLCAVRYYLKNISIGDGGVRCLMRGVSESSDVFAALREDRVADLWQPRDDDEPVAFGVLSVEFHLLQRGDAGAWEPWNDEHHTAPSAVEIVIVLARREFAMRLDTPEKWQQAEQAMHASAHDERDIERRRIMQRIGCDESDSR